MAPRTGQSHSTPFRVVRAVALVVVAYLAIAIAWDVAHPATRRGDCDVAFVVAAGGTADAGGNADAGGAAIGGSADAGGAAIGGGLPEGCGASGIDEKPPWLPFWERR